MKTLAIQSTPNRRDARLRRRRGLAVILVLGLLAMTLAASYALVRTQLSTAKSSVNGDLRASARQAAYTGLSTALRRMHQSGWTGVGTSITGTLGVRQSFAAAFATGDPTLSTSSVDAADWPYRVTITTTGYAVDPTASTVVTTYPIAAVVRLVPRQTAANPAPWASMQQYTVFQTDAQDVTLQPPLRITGTSQFQGRIALCNTYPATSAQRSRLLTDLNAMRTAGYGDNRPLDGPVYLPFSTNTTTTRSYLTSNLGLTLTDRAAATTTSWSHPGTIATYKIYPGGTSYTVPTLGSSLSNVTLTADPRTNPFGIFSRSGNLTLNNNVTIQGTVITSGYVQISGSNVTIQAASLPALDGSTAPVRLPAVISASDLRIGDGAGATVRGTAAVFDNFLVSSGTQDTRFDFQGRLITRDFDVQSRSEWNVGSSWWSFLWAWFNSQLSDSPDSRIDYFPVYLGWWGMDDVPHLTIAPPSGSVIPQWITSGTPTYAPAATDAGLRWNLLWARENP